MKEAKEMKEIKERREKKRKYQQELVAIRAFWGAAFEIKLKKTVAQIIQDHEIELKKMGLLFKKEDMRRALAMAAREEINEILKGLD